MFTMKPTTKTNIAITKIPQSMYFEYESLPYPRLVKRRGGALRRT